MALKPHPDRKPEPMVAAEPPALPTGELPSGKPQSIEIAGQRFMLVPEADYNVLIEAARDNIEDLADAADAIDILKRIESGAEETLPAELVHRIAATGETGESRIKIWREHRGLTQAQLGAAIGSDRLYVSQLETGVRKGSIDILQKIAAALRAPVELVLPKAAPRATEEDPVGMVAARCNVDRNTAEIIYRVIDKETNIAETLAARLNISPERASELILTAVGQDGLPVSARKGEWGHLVEGVRFGTNDGDISIGNKNVPAPHPGKRARGPGPRRKK